jgi:hypothetical protein
MDSLPEDAGAGPLALAVLSRFRRDFHACLAARADELSELADAVLCADGPVWNLASLSRLPGCADARPSPGRSSAGLTALAGPPPGQGLRPGLLIGRKRTGTKARSAQIEVSTVRGELRFVFAKERVMSAFRIDTDMAREGV